MVRESLLEKAMRAENLPADNFNHKKPLQRAVQLIKRYRDVYFQKDDTYKTSSIILTTLAGQLYNGEESIFATVENIITTIRSQVTMAGTRRIKVLNPVNVQEDFTDKWDAEPKYYTAFKNFCEHLYNEWQLLKKRQGVLNEGRVLGDLFGSDILIKAQTAQTLLLEKQRNAQQLGMDRKTGILGKVAAGTTVVKPNTFFGQ